MCGGGKIFDWERARGVRGELINIGEDRNNTGSVLTTTDRVGAPGKGDINSPLPFFPLFTTFPLCKGKGRGCENNRVE